MAQAPLSRELAEEAVRRVEDQLRAGYRPPGQSGSGFGAIRQASELAAKEGFCGLKAFETRLYIAKSTHGLEPDWTLYRPQRYQQPMPRQVIVPAGPTVNIPPSGAGVRVLGIGDLHQDPRHPDRIPILTWIARYASEHRFDRIWQAGDWSTNDSVNMHDRNDSIRGRYKPSIKDDLENQQQALQAWRRGMADGYKPKQDTSLGNHEYRLERFENANPEADQTFTLSRDEAFLQFGWRPRPYGELLYIEGVGFTHHPTNGAGRAFGGKTGPQRAANETTVSVVSGHTHRAQLHSAAKIGPLDSVQMIEIGCAMPWGTVEAYAQHSLTGWWWGGCPMTVCDGVVTDVSFVSMIDLRRRYSDDGADVAA